METKAIEIRDRHTFIPAIAIRMVPHYYAKFRAVTAQEVENEIESERFLLRRAGYPMEDPLVLLARMDADGGAHQISYDPYSWGVARTMGEAHRYIAAHWEEITSGQVIDVEFILGETATPKQSERLSTTQTP